MALRNLVTFLPALFAQMRGKSFDDFLGGTDPLDLSWLRLVESVRTLNPEANLTIWCDEDTPLIWPEVLRAVSGHAPGTVQEDKDDLLVEIMSPEGLDRMRAYLAGNPPASISHRRRILSAFFDKFAMTDKVEMELDLPDWDEAMVEEITERDREDIARLRGMSDVTFIDA
jgi:hypothetical protein